ncbi:MAG: hypothetical protein Q8R40_02365 [bacterium]|nr:hypothetical protein [bacterium]
MRQETEKNPQEIFSDMRRSLHSLPAQKRFMLAVATMACATLTVATVWFFLFLPRTNLHLSALGQTQQPQSLMDVTETAHVGPTVSIIESLKGLGEKIAPENSDKDPFGFQKTRESTAWVGDIFASLGATIQEYSFSLLKKAEQIGLYIWQELIFRTSRISN